MMNPRRIPHVSSNFPCPTTSYSMRLSCVSTPHVSARTPSGNSASYSSRRASIVSSSASSPRSSHSSPSSVLNTTCRRMGSPRASRNRSTIVSHVTHGEAKAVNQNDRTPLSMAEGFSAIHFAGWPRIRASVTMLPQAGHTQYTDVTLYSFFPPMTFVSNSNFMLSNFISRHSPHSGHWWHHRSCVPRKNDRSMLLRPFTVGVETSTALRL